MNQPILCLSRLLSVLFFVGLYFGVLLFSSQAHADIGSQDVFHLPEGPCRTDGSCRGYESGSLGGADCIVCINHRRDDCAGCPACRGCPVAIWDCQAMHGDEGFFRYCCKKPQRGDQHQQHATCYALSANHSAPMDVTCIPWWYSNESRAYDMDPGSTVECGDAACCPS